MCVCVNECACDDGDVCVCVMEMGVHELCVCVCVCVVCNLRLAGLGVPAHHRVASKETLFCYNHVHIQVMYYSFLG